MAAWQALRRAVPLWASGLSRRYSSNAQVGFIGLGNMGAPMANNLLQKGHKLVVYDLVKASVDSAVAAGATAATSPAQVAAEADIVITMLPASPHVLEAYSGGEGVLGSARKESLFIDCSTIDRATVMEVLDKTKQLGASFIDAPVSGGVGGATKGTLAFMVGGDKVSYDRAVPLLDCMGRAAFHCGSHGAGQAAKQCNNMVLAITAIGTCEALQLGINLGLDPKVLSGIINMASGRSWTSDTYNPCPGVMEGVPSSNNYEGGFRAGLMVKDLALAMDAASSSKSLTPLGSQATQLYRLLCEQGYADKDFTVMFKFLEKKDQ